MTRPAVLLLLATLCVKAEPIRQLLGQVFKGDDQSQSALANVKVVLDESGSRDISKDDGLFQLFLPDVFRAGDEVTITVELPGYAIYDPPGGKLRIPAELSRTRVTIRLLPKGSPKFFSHARLTVLVERTAREANVKLCQQTLDKRPDLSRFLRDWASTYGFTIDQVRVELNRWAAEVESHNPSKYELGFAAFARNNFREANARALGAAVEAEANIAGLDIRKQESTDLAIRAYLLAGNAAYSDLDFGAAWDAYGKALSHADRTRDPERWADLQIRLGSAEIAVASRSEGVAVAGHGKSAIKAFSLALEVYKRESQPHNWARAENDLGVALQGLAARTEGPSGASYLDEAAAAYKSALEVRTFNQLPQDWAATQNNLGNALRELAARSQGPQATRYLEDAVEAHRNALQVRTREGMPQDWAESQDNLASALRDLAWRNERQQGAARLGDAVAAYQNALQVRTRENLPQDWALTQSNLGNALCDLAAWSEGPQAVEYLSVGFPKCPYGKNA